MCLGGLCMASLGQTVISCDEGFASADLMQIGHLDIDGSNIPIQTSDTPLKDPVLCTLKFEGLTVRINFLLHVPLSPYTCHSRSPTFAPPCLKSTSPTHVHSHQWTNANTAMQSILLHPVPTTKAARVNSSQGPNWCAESPSESGTRSCTHAERCSTLVESQA